MAGQDPHQRARRNGEIAGNTRACNRLRIERLDQRQRSAADGDHLGGHILDVACGVRRRRGPHLFVHARQRRLVVARDVQQPVGEHPLGIGHVANHFLDVPLSFRVSIGRPVLGQPCQLLESRNLLPQRRHRARRRHAVDVARVVVVELGCGRAIDVHDVSTLSFTSTRDRCSSVATPCTSDGSCGTRTVRCFVNRRSISSR